MPLDASFAKHVGDFVVVGRFLTAIFLNELRNLSRRWILNQPLDVSSSRRAYFDVYLGKVSSFHVGVVVTLIPLSVFSFGKCRRFYWTSFGPLVLTGSIILRYSSLSMPPYFSLSWSAFEPLPFTFECTRRQKWIIWKLYTAKEVSEGGTNARWK